VRSDSGDDGRKLFQCGAQKARIQGPRCNEPVRQSTIYNPPQKWPSRRLDVAPANVTSCLCSIKCYGMATYRAVSLASYSLVLSTKWGKDISVPTGWVLTDPRIGVNSVERRNIFLFRAPPHKIVHCHSACSPITTLTEQHRTDC
jgi:hypothetical protein